MDGIINIYKEKGYTSFDVVAKLRRICHMKKIGHTGTLDPEAEGVLPVCLGKATRLVERMTDKEKEYRAVMRLGIVTDTQDTTGSILSESPVCVTEEEVAAAIRSFDGGYDQLPPMYSALKVDGKRLYELAREGKTVERKTRPVILHDFVIERIALPEVTFRVTCSRGTYIRTLCNDIGERLGCGAAMQSLLRTRSGVFELANAIRLSELEKLAEADAVENAVIPVETMFEALPKVTCLPEGEKRLRNGNRIPDEMLDLASVSERSDGAEIRVSTAENEWIGVYARDAKERDWRPVFLML